MSVKQLAFRKACATLSAIGAKFVVDFDGVVQTSMNTDYALRVGDGPLTGPLAPAIPTDHPVRAPRQSWAYTGLPEALKTLKVGEVWVHACASRTVARGLQASATGGAAKAWGPGNYISSIGMDNVFELLRVK